MTNAHVVANVGPEDPVGLLVYVWAHVATIPVLCTCPRLLTARASICCSYHCPDPGDAVRWEQADGQDPQLGYEDRCGADKG